VLYLYPVGKRVIGTDGQNYDSQDRASIAASRSKKKKERNHMAKNIMACPLLCAAIKSGLRNGLQLSLTPERATVLSRPEAVKSAYFDTQRTLLASLG